MMKKLVLILVVFLLCELVPTEAARRPSGNSGGAKKRVMCNGKLCAPGEFCAEFIQPPRCGAYDRSLGR
ncbi:hypothetical protein MTO96_001800 [Rhipicephalus appendiculatus]